MSRTAMISQNSVIGVVQWSSWSISNSVVLTQPCHAMCTHATPIIAILYFDSEMKRFLMWDTLVPVWGSKIVTTFCFFLLPQSTHHGPLVERTPPAMPPLTSQRPMEKTSQSPFQCAPLNTTVCSCSSVEREHLTWQSTWRRVLLLFTAPTPPCFLRPSSSLMVTIIW